MDTDSAKSEIADLICRYALEFDAADGDAVAALFMPDGVFVRPSGKRVEGADALRAMVAEASPMQHFPGPGAIDLEAEAATARSRIVVLRLDDGQVRLVTAGEYRDRLALHEGAWRFSERRFIPWLPAELTDLALGSGAQPD